MIVPRAVGELRPAGDVADGVDAARRGPIVIVDDHVAAPVERDPGGVATEVVGVGAAPHCDQEVRAPELFAVHVEDDVVIGSRDAADLDALTQVDALGAEHALQRRRHVGVLDREQVSVAIDDGDRGSEAPKHLPELAADVAAAQDQEMTRQLLEVHRPAVVEPRHLGETGDRRRRRPRAGVDDHGVGAVTLAGHLDLVCADEARAPLDHAQPITRFGETVVDALAPGPHDGVLAGDDRGEVDAHLAGVDAEARRGAGHVRGARAGDHRLGWGAAVVRARAAKERALDQREHHGQRSPDGPRAARPPDRCR